jgi:hypothetical protein
VSRVAPAGTLCTAHLALGPRVPPARRAGRGPPRCSSPGGFRAWKARFALAAIGNAALQARVATARKEIEEKEETMAQELIDAIRIDHQEIKSLMEQVDRAVGDREETFRRLVAKLATHETAEEEVVHPLARKAPNGDAIVEARLEEESEGKSELARLEKMGVDDPAFTAGFEKLRTAVLAHAEHEETQEHPLLRDAVDAERLRKAADLFRKAEGMGPTHAHAHSPESATGNVLVGTFVAVADRVRDALRSAS